ncbi:IS5/IS1182 family transposase, partial [Escherichia coli]|nr:IS5/IS1182 family transposase [Escherichia coli]
VTTAANEHDLNQLGNLLHGGSKFRGRNNLFSGGDSSKTSFLVLLTPEK